MAELTESWPLAVGMIYLAICGATQCTWQRVPNLLTLFAVILGLLVSTLVQFGVAPGDGGIASSVVAALVGFFVLLRPYYNGSLGAACLKCQIAFGIWLGCSFTMGTAVALMFVGTLLSIVVTFAASWIWMKIDTEAELFPAQLTISLATIGTALVARLA